MAAAAVEFNPTRQGKFKVLIGDSLKPGAEESQLSNGYSSFRYNTTPPESLSKLVNSGDGQFGLSYDDDKDTTYTGSQRPGRKLECVLLYNPKDNTFTLERMSSVFTFNQSHPNTEVAPIPPATYEDETTGNLSDDEDAQIADVENPFDVRHFTGRVQPESEDDEDEGKVNEDTDVEMEDVDNHTTAMDIEPEQETALTPGPSASTPIPASSATPTPAPALPPLKRKPKKAVDPFMKPTRKPKAAPTNTKSPLLHPGTSSIMDDRKEASMSPQPALPSPMHIDRKPAGASKRYEESSESDVDESDEDSDAGGRYQRNNNNNNRQPYNKNLQAGTKMSREPSSTSIFSNRATEEVLDLPDPKSEEKDDGGLDESELFAAMAEEFDMSDEDDDGGAFGGGDLTIEGEPERGIGLGINNVNTGVVPLSLSRMVDGGSRIDDSEEESSEEE